MQLVIRRDGTVEQQHDVGDRDLRIGRDRGNDIVLDESTQSISRFHAELRSERDGYWLIDLSSQNGIWVSGRRVQRVDLRPGLTAAIGPYTLTLEDITMTARDGPRSTTRAAEPATTEALHLREEEPARPAARPAPLAPPRSGAVAWLARQPKPLVFGAFALVVILVIGLMLAIRPDSTGSGAPTESIAGSEAQKTATVLTNEQAVTDRLRLAQERFEAGDFDGALDHVRQALLVIPNHGGSLDLGTKIEAERQRRGGSTSPGSTPAGDGASTVLAGRLERLEKELAAIDEAVRQLRTGQAQRTKELEGELARIDEALRRVRTQMKAP